jgi:putative phosphoesterase
MQYREFGVAIFTNSFKRKDTQRLCKRIVYDNLRIAAISDLHVLPDGSDRPLLECIRQRVEEIQPDVFIVAGDISDHLAILSESLALLRSDKCTNLYVAGNHDIWFEDAGGPGSLEKYSHRIGEICHENGFHHLPDSPVIQEDIAFVGSIGWYDYSFRRVELDIPIKHYEQKEYRGAVWYDLFKIDWSLTDVEATTLFNQKLEYDLKTLPDYAAQVIYVSHHLPFQKLTVYKDRLPWDFHSAFMGATSTGKILEKDNRIVLSISGHSHVRTHISEATITAITVPLGYGRPARDCLENFVQDAVAVIEIREEDVSLSHFIRGDLSIGLPYASSRD